MTIEIEAQQEETDWAYKYGQEARKAVELDWRLNSCIFDMGIMSGLLDKFLEKLGKDDDSWKELIPHILDQKFDMDNNVRNHMQRAIASYAEQDRIMELQKRVTDKVATKAEEKEIDELTGAFLEECNKKVFKDFDEWLNQNDLISINQMRDNHREHWMRLIPKVFAAIIISKANPDDPDVQQFLKEALSTE